MKKIQIITSLILVLLAACTKVITVNTKNAPQQIVVEASISTSDTLIPSYPLSVYPIQISLSKSVEVYQTNTFPVISNATVIISDNAGNIDTVQEKTPNTGIYVSNKLKGVVGNTYNLKILTDGQTITSSCTIPNNIMMDSIYAEKRIKDLNSPITYEMNVVYTDPKNISNYYRFIVYDKGKNKSFNLSEDKFSDGNKKTFRLYTSGFDILKGDTVTIEMQNLSKAPFEYFLGFTQINGNNNSATPSNPATNLTGTNLGYFSAHSSNFKTIIIQ